MLLQRMPFAHRRRLFRVLFITCGLLPTLTVGAWATWRANWQGATYYAQRLSRILGSDVTLKDVVPLRPGAYQVHGLTLYDTETRQTVGTCESVEIVRGPGGFAIHVVQLEVVRGQIIPLWRQFHRLLVERDADSPEVFVTLDNARIVTTPDRYSEGRVIGNSWQRINGQLHFSHQVDGPEVRATLMGDHNDVSDACHLRILRHRRTERPATRVAVTTGNDPVRCDLLPGCVAWARQLGTNATFRGACWMQNETSLGDAPGGGWRGEITGVVAGVDLESLSDAHSSHQLTGTAEIAVETCCFEQSRILELDAMITSGPGVVAQSLLEAMADELGAVLHGEGSLGSVRPDGTDASAAVRPYQRLSAQLHLQPQGVTLRGRCSDQIPGAIICDASGPLLTESHANSHSAAALLTAMAPKGTDTAPVNRTAQRLMRWLPMPPK